MTRLNFKESMDYSQFGQDWFVDTVLRNKRGGYFLDIGCGISTLSPYEYPISCMSNTYGLEMHRGWDGLGIDCNIDYFRMASRIRKTIVCADLLVTDINSILKRKEAPLHMDYLSFDVDTAQRKVFADLDFDKYSFSVITYEHNHSAGSNTIERDYSRSRFERLGYKLLFGDVGLDNEQYIEDWWVSQELYKEWEYLAPQNEREQITTKKIIELFQKEKLYSAQKKQ